MIYKKLFLPLLLIATFGLCQISSLYSEDIPVNQHVILEISKIKSISIDSPTSQITLGDEHISPGDIPFQSENYNENTLNLTALSDKPQKIIALLNSSLPKGMKLSVNLQPPPGAKGHGYQTLSTKGSITLISAIPNICSAKALPLSYKFSVEGATSPQLGDAHIIYKILDDN